jgi:predicted lipoprotein with Yx(FWY)xxD motif
VRYAVVAIFLLGIALAFGGTASAMAAEKTRLKVRSSPYGKVLFADGYAMYVFTADSGATSNCYGACAKAWPPLRAQGRIVAGAGVDRDRVGVTERRGARRQLTYAGQPLYGYVHDPRGEVYCQDVEEFGGIWYAVRGSGEPVG